MKEKQWLPDDRLYDGESYVWVKEADSQEALILGMGAPQLSSLGDLVYLTLEEPGTMIMRGDVIGSLEAAKMTGELTSPVSGKVIDRNEQALANPSMVSNDPYENGWLLKVVATAWPSEQINLYGASALAQKLAAESSETQTSI